LGGSRRVVEAAYQSKMVGTKLQIKNQVTVEKVSQENNELKGSLGAEDPLNSRRTQRKGGKKKGRKEKEMI